MFLDQTPRILEQIVPTDDDLKVNVGPTIRSVTIAVTVLALCMFSMRLYVRIFMIRALGVDDWWMMAAMVLSTIGMGFVMVEIEYGAGRHQYGLPAETVKKGLLYNFITQPLYLWAITFVKCSIAFFLSRIAPSNTYKRFLLGSIAFLLVYTFACFLSIMFQCRPIDAIWDSTVTSVCYSSNDLLALAYVNSGLNVLTDILFAVLPVPMMWNVQINKRTKIALVLVMSLGVFASIAGIIKLTILKNYGKTGDFLYDSASLTIWTVTECNIGILAASAPCVKPLFRKILDKSGYSGGKYSGGCKRDTRGYYNQSSHKGHSLATFKRTQGSQRPPLSKDESTVTIRGRGDESLRTSTPSEESILPIQTAGFSIVKTTHVEIKHDEPDTTGMEVPVPRTVEDRV